MNPQSSAFTELCRQVRGLFRASPEARSPARVGAEMELLVLDRRSFDGRGVVPVDRLRGILTTDPGLAAEARFSFEPGGQLELSPPPAVSPRQLSATLRRLVGRTGALLAHHGIEIVSQPVDSWRTADQLGLQVAADRYLVMQRHFDSIGSAGRQMMRRTASLQINVDLLPGAVGRRQWLLANLAGPALAMAFGRSAPDAGAETRLAIWFRVDPGRTGYDGVQVDGVDSAAAYQEFALAAEAMPLPRDADCGSGAGSHQPARRSFHDWARFDAARPDARDVAHHLSTLFPPVRPRGSYLEIRYIDAQPAEWLDVPIAVLATLLADDRATQAGLEIVGRDSSRLAARWRAALAGDDETLLATGLDLIDLVARRGRVRAAAWLPPMAVDLVAAYADRYLRLPKAPPAALAQRALQTMPSNGGAA